jgi:hypothetical protein
MARGRRALAIPRLILAKPWTGHRSRFRRRTRGLPAQASINAQRTVEPYASSLSDLG